MNLVVKVVEQRKVYELDQLGDGFELGQAQEKKKFAGNLCSFADFL